MVFAIDFKHFRMNKKIFEAFELYLLSILAVFRLTKTLLKFQMVFAIDFERFRIDENIFEGFAFYNYPF